MFTAKDFRSKRAAANRTIKQVSEGSCVSLNTIVNLESDEKNETVSLGLARRVWWELSGWEDTHFVYIYDMGGKIKVGRSANPEKRKHQLRGKFGGGVMVFNEPCKSEIQSHRVENMAHYFLSEYRCEGEVFSCEVDIAKKAIKHASLLYPGRECDFWGNVEREKAIFLDSVTKAHIAKVGRQKGGRKRDEVWLQADDIKRDAEQGIHNKDLAHVYKTSEATIRRILTSRS